MEKGSGPSRAFVLDRAYSVLVENGRQENLSAMVRSVNCNLIRDMKNDKCYVCAFARVDLVSWKVKDA